MVEELRKHLCTQALDDEEVDDSWLTDDNADNNGDGGDDDGASRPIDPRWNELKKILDNN
jgi:hypothetical protein